MSPAQQRRFYFPAWNDLGIAHGWYMSRGRLKADMQSCKNYFANLHPDNPARDLGLQVIDAADNLAATAHRAVNAEDLRHACNFVAAGKLSSSVLDNKQTNRVVTLFRLLRDPDDLDAVMNWLHPEQAEQKSFVAYLRKLEHEAALIAIASNAFGTRNWDQLPIEKLRWICKQMKNRTSTRRPGPALQPF